MRNMLALGRSILLGVIVHAVTEGLYIVCAVWAWCDVEKVRTLTVAASTQLPLPLQFVNSDMHIRPSNWSLHWCLSPVRWQVVTKSAEPHNSDYSCDMLGGPSNAYRYYSVTHFIFCAMGESPPRTPFGHI